MDFAALYAELQRDEGLRLKPYKDTVGKWTVGVGRNLDDVGITEDEANFLLANDVRKVLSDLDRRIPWWRNLSENRQRALVNMGFNLGWGRLAKFTHMLAALEAGDYSTAAGEALTSAWSKQVGSRALRIASMIAEG